MKICTYNLRFGGHKNPGNHWQRVLDDLGADIICAQESEDPSKYFSPEQFAGFKGRFHENVAHGKWGSAIFARDYALESITVPGFDGWVVGARIKGVKLNGTPQTVTVFCVHAPSPGPYEPQVNRILDEIAKLQDGSPLLIAGDFNLTTAVRHASEDGMRNTAGERRIFERLRREFGLINAWQVLHPNKNLPQTLRWARAPTKPYHCDAIFISHSLLPNLLQAEVIQHGEFATLSDHNPILVELA
jgi:exonuclease III